MILDELRLKNFGLYRGEQVFRLTPASRGGRSQPIVLVGGMNGAGKTTLLDAIRLALYGSRCRSSRRDGGYDEFLRDAIHRETSPADGAGVSLSFRVVTEGAEHAYEVRRRWSQRGQTLRERVHVFCDGAPQPSLAECWTDFVEEVIPLGISQLFFFDAEKIRFLADENVPTDSLGNAVKSLLGLDLAERLIADMQILEGRLTERSAVLAADPELSSVQQQIDSLESELRKLKSERADLENRRLRAERDRDERQAAFAASGGEHWKNHAVLVRELQSLEERQTALTDELADLAAGEAALLLVPDLLSAAQSQSAHEVESRRDNSLCEVLKQRDRDILRALKAKKLSTKSLSIVTAELAKDRRARQRVSRIAHRLHLSETAEGLLVQLLSPRGLSNLRDNVSKTLRDYRRTEQQIEQVILRLQAVPKEEDIAELVTELQVATEAVDKVNVGARRLDVELTALHSRIDILQRQAHDRRRALVETSIAAEQSARMLDLAMRTQETMRSFLEKATARKIDRLSILVSDCFRFLLRKKTLVHHVQIDPVTFAIAIYDHRGDELPKHRLSEGEKQMFAVSLLWGLAQAAPRPLPAIIDTPMARLDAEHRQNLIERYFPNASHQVIILSTDTEVDEDFYVRLQPHIARAYYLSYDEDSRATTAREGYFWQHEAELEGVS